MFYLKLALLNLKKNSRTYGPFLLSMIFLMVMNTIMQIIFRNDGMSTLPGAQNAKSMFGLGNYIIVVFIVVFSLYANSFLLKQRKKELGLYNILGLGKRELAIVLLWETMISYVVTLAFGLTIGSVFAKIGFLLLKKMTGFGSDFIYNFSFPAVLTVAGTFLAVFLLLFIWNVLQLKFVSPQALLKGSQHGEKEPKVKWLLALAGILCLGTGYGISVTIVSPIDALNLFFIAVILVIVGTYLLFTASSIAVLKLLKNNKNYYYQLHHFISVSNMIYRMKQNAAGLASICILCTMVMVTVATTGSLYVGTDAMLKNFNPHDISITTRKDRQTDVKEMLHQLADQHHLKSVKVRDITTSEGLALIGKKDGYEALLIEQGNMTAIKNAEMFSFMTSEEYERVTGEPADIADDEIYLYEYSGNYPADTIKIAGHTFKIVHRINEMDAMPKAESISDAFLLVMSSEELITKLADELLPDDGYSADSLFSTMVYADFQGKEEERLAFAREMKQFVTAMPDSPSCTSIDIDRESSKSFTGGFLFLGMIFGLMFTLATGIIIYYKQISEGVQDQQRYDIMQRVGMSHKEVRQTINSQVLMVFFFPIALAALHLAFAFPIIRKLLLLFGLANWQLFLWISVTTVLIFFVLYLLMYFQTSKVYYRIVERTPGTYTF